MSEKKQILVVTVPAGSIKPDGFAKFREYVIESILRDVLVLDSTMKLSMEEVPALEPPRVMVNVALAEGDSSPPEPDKPEGSGKVDVKTEKRQILERLLVYRSRNGLGSLNDVAMRTNVKSITPDTLRLLVKGDATLTIAEWRAIGRALDKLEEKEREVAHAGNG